MQEKKKKELRSGFTTGSCAAAASSAAAHMLLFGSEINEIRVETPKGPVFTAEILNITRNGDSVKCAVRKDAGDDPDITHGALIYSEVSFSCGKIPEAASKIDPAYDDGAEESASLIIPETGDPVIIIDGGEGVGRVTKPGLDQKVGNAAINHVPREMIEKELRKVCSLADFHGTLRVVISCPEGVEIAKKTFNPKLGIVGGISILGTSGVVEPMSMKALLDTIKTELNVRKAEGYEKVVVAPGNYGRDFLKGYYGYDIDRSVKCSNFIGDAIDMASDLEFDTMLLVGHIGKLVKVSGGILNTHSKEGDCRMELLSAAALLAGADGDTCRKLLSCVTTEDGLKILDEKGLFRQTLDILFDRIMATLKKRSDDRIHIECLMYSNVLGVLAKSSKAEEIIRGEAVTG